uniref:Amidohydrolase-related domain-containing protein n=1 Tax=Acyrthosiphon pisum TaxID=7029 RepID=A0A8R2HC20_ACYPI|eukprot:XP_016664567.1 PREDICTED: 5-methylthioadenosine/S-adenosylhomocysteine deaminase-like [Acyrthosiphon pisum]
MQLALMAAAENAGIGQTLLPVLYSYSGFGSQPASNGQRRFIQQTDAYLQQQQRVASWSADKPLLNHGICFHSLRAVNEAQMHEVLAACPQDVPVHIHVAEQEKEVNDSLAWSDERPVAWLLNRFKVDQRWCLIHATHLDDDEIQRMAASGAVAGLCPTTEANLGDGIFPAVEYIARGGRWGIGSDSHVSLSALEELRWLESIRDAPATASALRFTASSSSAWQAVTPVMRFFTSARPFHLQTVRRIVAEGAVIQLLIDDLF